MTEMDNYATFKAAFASQTREIQRIYSEVSKFEQMNSEVLSHVEKTGNLPEFIANASNSPRTTSNALSNVVAQQTSGLPKALENLGIGPSACHQLLGQIQQNMSTILHSQLTRPLTAQSESDSGLRSATGSKQNSPGQSFYSRTDGEADSQLSSSAATSHGDVGYPSTGRQMIAYPPENVHRMMCPQASQMEIQSPREEILTRRRQELARINQRTPMHMASEIPIPCLSRPVTDTRYRPEEDSFLRASSAICAVRPTSSAISHTNVFSPEDAFGVATTMMGSSSKLFKNPMRALQNLSASCVHSLPTESTQLEAQQSQIECPCGGARRSCPLSKAKQLLFACDARVEVGFTLLAAIVRGRFIRNLLATNKVYELIRTVKDTAKLALSIHVERQTGVSKKPPPNAWSDYSSKPQERETNEEFVLETRLLTQLRTALGQLHDIFFSWPRSSQMELLQLFRSLPARRISGRGRRVATRSSGAREESYRPESPMSDESNDSGAKVRGTVEFHRRENSTVSQWSPSQDESSIGSESRILRQLQPDQIDREKSQVVAVKSTTRTEAKYSLPYQQSECSGSPSTTEQQLPQHPTAQRRSAGIINRQFLHTKANQSGLDRPKPSVLVGTSNDIHPSPTILSTVPEYSSKPIDQGIESAASSVRSTETTTTSRQDRSVSYASNVSSSSGPTTTSSTITSTTGLGGGSTSKPKSTTRQSTTTPGRGAFIPSSCGKRQTQPCRMGRQASLVSRGSSRRSVVSKLPSTMVPAPMCNSSSNVHGECVSTHRRVVDVSQTVSSQLNSGSDLPIRPHPDSLAGLTDRPYSTSPNSVLEADASLYATTPPANDDNGTRMSTSMHGSGVPQGSSPRYNQHHHHRSRRSNRCSSSRVGGGSGTSRLLAAAIASPSVVDCLPQYPVRRRIVANAVQPTDTPDFNYNPQKQQQLQHHHSHPDDGIFEPAFVPEQHQLHASHHTRFTTSPQQRLLTTSRKSTPPVARPQMNPRQVNYWGDDGEEDKQQQQYHQPQNDTFHPSSLRRRHGDTDQVLAMDALGEPQQAQLRATWSFD